jgi:hypothetical protein
MGLHFGVDAFSLETAGQKIYCVNMKDFLENRTAQ